MEIKTTKRIDEILIKTPEGNFVCFDCDYWIIKAFNGKNRLVIDTHDSFMTKEAE
jgi:hypothetical protein